MQIMNYYYSIGVWILTFIYLQSLQKKKKHSKFAGLSREKRRRLQFKEEDEAHLKTQKLVAKSAKSAVKPGKLSVAGGQKSTNNANASKGKKRAKVVESAGFASELTETSKRTISSGGGNKKANNKKKAHNGGGIKAFKSKKKFKRRK